MKNMKRIFVFAAVGIFLAAAPARALNLMDLRNSPLKSLLAIQKAVRAHDADTVEKYVSLESFIGRVYDDGLAAVDESGNSKLVSYAAMTGVYKLIRPYAVSYAKKCVIENIKRDPDAPKPAEKPKPDLKNEKLNSAYDAFERKRTEIIERINPANVIKETIDFENSEILRVSTHKKTKEGAIVAADIYNTELRRIFTLKLRLEPIGKKGWRVVEPMNFKEYALAIDRAKKAGAKQR